MASTSCSSIVLPSIHEIFPEHLMPRSASRPRAAPMPAPTAGVLPRSHFVQPRGGQAFSFDVLRSDPRGASLQHIASRRPPGRRSDLPAVRTGPSSGHSSSGSSDGDAEMEDAEDGADGEEGVTEEGKKHVCPTCSKRFNRPSSLRIHVNTHTGATPFRCAHPNCGRAFNVNSNMRRHFRNHTSPTFGAGVAFPSPPTRCPRFRRRAHLGALPLPPRTPRQRHPLRAPPSRPSSPAHRR
ncbi:hypothetical protein DFH07DRAFT_831068 [Mycena maculata]|uniref:C2H2-type domain-containing protein n=1 Tax=Mycena maculata TaxID=230809 RepID=A0AAD7INZ1_9AGAR|nr:hypothetical protein DFH07DRAFT_831068 [Mycena maculata]